jgi:hypothetical protein
MKKFIAIVFGVWVVFSCIRVATNREATNNPSALPPSAAPSTVASSTVRYTDGMECGSWGVSTYCRTTLAGRTTFTISSSGDSSSDIEVVNGATFYWRRDQAEKRESCKLDQDEKLRACYTLAHKEHPMEANFDKYLAADRKCFDEHLAEDKCLDDWMKAKPTAEEQKEYAKYNQ